MTLAYIQFGRVELVYLYIVIQKFALIFCHFTALILTLNVYKLLIIYHWFSIQIFSAQKYLEKYAAKDEKIKVKIFFFFCTTQVYIISYNL